MINNVRSDLNPIDAKIDTSPEALAQLGDGRIAYVKTIRSEDVAALFPQAQMPQIAPPKSMSRHRVRGEDAVECLAGMGHPGCS